MASLDLQSGAVRLQIPVIVFRIDESRIYDNRVCVLASVFLPGRQIRILLVFGSPGDSEQCESLPVVAPVEIKPSPHHGAGGNTK
jgi:hypothetical protein